MNWNFFKSAARNITARKLADELNVRLAAIVDHSNDAIVSISLERKILYWNSGAQRMFGYSAAEVMGRNIVDLIVPSDREPEVPKIREQFDAGLSVLDFETVRMTRDGGTIDVSLSQSPCTDEHGNILSISLIFRDIRERKRAEEALRQSEAHNRKLLDVSPDGIWIHSQGTIHYVNEALVKMLGYARAEELHGRSIYEFFPPQERDALRSRVKTTSTKSTPITTITSRLRHDGTLIPVEVTAAAYVQDGKSWNIAIARDISERNRADAERTELEAQLRESQKMEALGTLAGGVAHDFNNALASILGNVELARQDVGPGHVALVSLEEIGKASRRAKDLVQQILTFGRRQTLERNPTSLALVVVESARFLRATLPAKVRLIMDCKPETPAVLADATQIKQIMINLYNNALQAVEDQEAPGLIEVCLHAHTQAEMRGDMSAGRYACLTVRDNGRGMDEVTRSHIFEPFFTTKPRGKGTGLGLSVVHGIVQTHQASIEVDSSPGQGSTFRIYFPATEFAPQALDAPVPPSAQVQVQGRHVLYLDDEEAIIFLMTRLLERKGFRVSGYTDQRAALDAVRANPGEFDLAVTDYNMPGMSGLDVAQELKEIRPDLPVVLASGYITEELRAQAPGVGIRELIYKPNTVDDLCDAVVRLARSFKDKSKPSE